MARKPDRRPTRSLFRSAVSQHTSGDQVSGDPQEVDLSDVDTGTTDSSLTEAQQLGQEEKTVDLSKVDLTPTPRKPSRLGGKSREQLAAEMRAEELDTQLYLRADARAKKIRSRPEFQPGPGFYTPAADPSKHGDDLRALKAGKGTLTRMTATAGFNHVTSTLKEINDFVTNIPKLLKAKADAHEKAANELEKLYPDHPDVAHHRSEAANIRGLLPGGPDVRNNLREVRDNPDSDISGGISQDSSRSLERLLMPIKNKLVEAGAHVAVIPTTEKEAAAGLGTLGKLNENSKRSHSSIKKAHATLASLHQMIRKSFGTYGIGPTTSSAYMELQGQRVINLQDKPGKPDVSGYQDVRDDLEPGVEGRLSKPGHIWGDHKTVAGRKTGEREQIPISEESIQMLKKRSGGQAKLHINRMRSIINSGKSPEEKSAATVEKGETSLFAYSKDAEEASLVRARAAGRTVISDGEEVEFAPAGGPRTQRREGNKVKSVAVDPRKVTTVGTHKGAVQQVAAARSAVTETEGHINVAVRALIDGKPIPAETMAHIERLPNKNGEQEQIADTIFARHQAHQDAVAGAIKDVQATGKISREHRDVFKREGTNPVDIVKLAKGA
jgi:hypothetical protein